MNVYDFIQRSANAVNHLIISPLKCSCFRRRGKKVYIGRGTRFIGIHNIEAGNHVTIGQDCMLMTAYARIILEDHVFTGPNVTIITGDHRFDIPGRTMDNIRKEDKLAENDQDVVFAGDNWIGANATILKEVKIGYGAVVAACSLVIDDVPDYSIVGGVPAKVIRKRFN